MAREARAQAVQYVSRQGGRRLSVDPTLEGAQQQRLGHAHIGYLIGRLSLIRFRGHLPKAGYDGTHGIKQGWPPVHVAHDRVVQRLQQAEEVFTKRQRLGEDVIAFAFALKSRALARLGELLADLAKAKGGTPYKSTRSNSEQVERTATLTDLGIDRKTSMVAQQLAAPLLATREAIA